MHTYRLLIDPLELEAIILPVLQENGSEIPERGCYAAAVEFDEDGSVVAYQMLQNAIFLEGLWARDHSAHLRNLHNMATKYAVEVLGAKRLMVMTRQDATGDRIGKLARALGFEQMKWNIFRRKQICQQQR
jgi:hypothetical protein